MPSYLSEEDQEFVKSLCKNLRQANLAMKVWYVKTQSEQLKARADALRVKAYQANIQAAGYFGKAVSLDLHSTSVAQQYSTSYQELTKTYNDAVNNLYQQLSSRNGPEKAWGYAHNAKRYVETKSIMRQAGVSEEALNKFLRFNTTATGANKGLINQFFFRADQLSAQAQQLTLDLADNSKYPTTLPYSKTSAEFAKSKVNKIEQARDAALYKRNKADEQAKILDDNARFLSGMYILAVLGDVLQELGQNLSA